MMYGLSTLIWPPVAGARTGASVGVVAADEGRLDAVPGCAGLQLDLDEIWNEIARLEHPR